MPDTFRRFDHALGRRINKRHDKFLAAIACHQAPALVRQRARDGADGQEPDVVGRRQLEARVANRQRIRRIGDVRGEEAVLRCAGMSVGNLVLGQF